MTTKMTSALVTLGGAILIALGGPAFAHHNLVAQFSTAKPLSLRGALVRIEWTNPHGWIYLTVKREDGRMEEWAVETGSPYAMEKRGLKRTDFKPGEDILIVGFAARDGSRKAAGIAVTFLDREAKLPGDASFTLGR